MYYKLYSQRAGYTGDPGSVNINTPVWVSLTKGEFSGDGISNYTGINTGGNQPALPYLPAGGKRPPADPAPHVGQLYQIRSGKN